MYFRKIYTLSYISVCHYYILWFWCRYVTFVFISLFVTHIYYIYTLAMMLSVLKLYIVMIFLLFNWIRWNSGFSHCLSRLSPLYSDAAHWHSPIYILGVVYSSLQATYLWCINLFKPMSLILRYMTPVLIICTTYIVIL